MPCYVVLHNVVYHSRDGSISQATILSLSLQLKPDCTSVEGLGFETFIGR